MALLCPCRETLLVRREGQSPPEQWRPFVRGEEVNAVDVGVKGWDFAI